MRYYTTILEIGQFWAHTHAIPFPNNKIYIASTAMDLPPNTGWQHLNKLLFKMNQEGEIIFDSIYNQSSLEMTMDMIRFPGTDQLVLYCVSNFEGGNMVKPINIIDTNYNLIESYYIEDYSLQASLRALNDTSFIISNQESGDKTEPWYTAISTYDLDFQRIKHVITGQADTASYPAYNNSIAIIENNIYVGSTFNVIPADFPNAKSFFRLDKLDLDLNIEWHKYYGGDAYYKFIDVRETPDNNILLTGSIYDHGDSGPIVRDIFVIKADQNGLITSTNQEQTIPIKNAIITPNPGKDYLQLHTGIYPAKLQIFNIKGQLVLEEDIHQNNTTINHNTSPRHLYWAAFKRWRSSGSDKWVEGNFDLK